MNPNTSPEALAALKVRLTGETPVKSWTEADSVMQQAADVIAALETERESFHMNYRMKCDEETKRLATERDAALADAKRGWHIADLCAEGLCRFDAIVALHDRAKIQLEDAEKLNSVPVIRARNIDAALAEDKQ